MTEELSLTCSCVHDVVFSNQDSAAFFKASLFCLTIILAAHCKVHCCLWLVMSQVFRIWEDWVRVWAFLHYLPKINTYA